MGGGPRVVGCTLGRRGTKGIVGDCLGILEIDLSDIGAIRLSLVVSNGSKLLLAALCYVIFTTISSLLKSVYLLCAGPLLCAWGSSPILFRFLSRSFCYVIFVYGVHANDDVYLLDCPIIETSAGHCLLCYICYGVHATTMFTIVLCDTSDLYHSFSHCTAK